MKEDPLKTKEWEIIECIDWLKDTSGNVEIPSLLVSDPSNEKICEAPRQTDQTLKVFSPDN